MRFDRHVTDKANKDKKGVFSPSFAVEMLVTRTTGSHTPFLGDDKVKKNVATSFLTEKQQQEERRRERRRAQGLPVEDHGISDTGEHTESGAASGAGDRLETVDESETGMYAQGAGCYLCDTESDTEQELLRGEGLEGLIDDEDENALSGLGDRFLGGTGSRARVGSRGPAPAPPSRSGKRRAWIAEAEAGGSGGESPA